ncbi:hypothetical protein HOLleu_29253 [Holothuria leucospilota]|uniref:Uncharacterized protein n=1 Tax=Holothuria leucospilota TaxID=206669 RepID=A0A9Q1H177_HOLLE|nr:hypothetical protein HOLleu_29253 [Holothuria leucospilota]
MCVKISNNLQPLLCLYATKRIEIDQEILYDWDGGTSDAMDKQEGNSNSNCDEGHKAKVTHESRSPQLKVQDC